MAKRIQKHLFFGVTLGFGLGITYYSLVKRVKKTSTFEPTPAAQQRQNTIIHDLEKESREIQDNLAKIGVTAEKIAAYKKNYYQQYIESDQSATPNNVAKPIQDFVHGILKDHGINPHEITLVKWTDPSPAAATLKRIFINEKTFSELSESARRFVIGHEVQHILHEDNLTIFLINNILETDIEKLAENTNNHNHPYCLYSRFIEKRADMKAALKNELYAQGYVDFLQERIKKYGDTPTGTHPLRAERLKVAQTILEQHKNLPMA
jgi:HD-GYP domain-containing protein (c-di-GMP phosphodiesterase class II)